MSVIPDCFLHVALKIQFWNDQVDDWELMNLELSSSLHLSQSGRNPRESWGAQSIIDCG